jgi:hypothetical protein
MFSVKSGGLPQVNFRVHSSPFYLPFHGGSDASEFKDLASLIFIVEYSCKLIYATVKAWGEKLTFYSCGL